jgi:uncharacterized repeat protein (TIGR03803 family)
LTEGKRKILDIPATKVFCSPVEGLRETVMTNLRTLATIALIGLLSRYGDAATMGVTPKVLFNFDNGADGGQPQTWLVQGTDGNFYGTASQGGAHNTGTVFQFTSAGTLTTLYSFTGGADGATPVVGLVQGTDSNFYGTTFLGGTNNDGTVFQISSNGVFASLYGFTGGTDGGLPIAGLVQGSDGNFYGTTSRGGASGTGTVFQITSAGTLTTLYSFTGGADGATPEAGLVQGTDSNFYGTTFLGGTNNDGTIFQISSNGVITTLHQFDKRTDGKNPEAALVQGNDSYFYGTTYAGGAHNDGTIFKISSAGTFSTLYHFGGPDGSNPRAALIQAADGYFYGTTLLSGFRLGTVFQVNSNGVLTTLYSFAGGTDGGAPYAGLVEASDGYFYGTTAFGGSGLHGTVFRFSTFPGGTYSGLAIQTNAPSAASSGFLSLDLRVSGSFMAKLTVGGVRSNFRGQFDVSGNATNTLTPKNQDPLQVIMHLNKGGGSNEILGTVSNGVFKSELLADLAGVFSKTNPCPVAGQYTFDLAPADTNDTTVPQGFGYGTLRVTTLGKGSLRGVLGDGTKIKATVPISGLSTFPLYNAMYKNKRGAAVGWITFSTNATIDASVDWFKPMVANNRFYPAGFTTTVALNGAKYVSPSDGGPSIAGSAQLTLGGGNMPSNLVKSVVISSNGSVTVSPLDSDRLILAIQPKTGDISGSFFNAAIHKNVTLNGLWLQSDNSGAGLFQGTNRTGFITLEPGP